MEALKSTETNPFGYAEPIWELFTHPPQVGEFPPGTAGVVSGEAGSKAARSVLRLQLRLELGRVADARFRAYGCPSSIAVGGWIARWSLGKTVDELRGLRAAELRQALEIPDDRAHCALLGEDAVRAALSGYNAAS
jgi:NifU-like protein involved in Fe-S cluster formation